MITIINYGLGNINAIKRVYDNLNIPVSISSKAEDLSDADKFILPGVGAFDYAMTKFNKSGMKDILHDKIINEGKKILGICVGMQMMAKRSDEGVLSGLGWLDADIKKFDTQINGKNLSIPHMGWNNIFTIKQVSILNGLNNDSFFYFLHSFYFHTSINDMIIAKAKYGHKFICAVKQENIDKSQGSLPIF